MFFTRRDHQKLNVESNNRNTNHILWINYQVRQFFLDVHFYLKFFDGKFEILHQLPRYFAMNNFT